MTYKIALNFEDVLTWQIHLESEWGVNIPASSAAGKIELVAAGGSAHPVHLI